ncbi:hypothetical protein GCM10028806_51350 [Spirosoma terrae]|uniref:Lipocalin-like domain-containing protein n=1 Tax=Spirosoma terrae TaxID=1968276 RepID=A0A6L9LIR1_9BACT|nr:hypothetical protein [Spirosoma terrae]NDU96489.1 hypothetical protein [Spirosoma terrae]
MRLSIYTFCLLLAFISCRKETAISPDTLTGTWIELSARQDTIIFNLAEDGTALPGFLIVNRIREMSPAGYWFPKAGSGIYSYELQNNRIFLRNLYSSSSMGADYTIEQRGNELEVENFYELGYKQPASAKRTLIRIK